MTGSDGSENVARINRLIQASQSGDYSTTAALLREARELFHQELAKQMTVPLNKQLSSMPQATLAQKRDLIRFANAEMRTLGIAVRCPKTGQPAMLHADPGHHPTEGRFQIDLIEHKKGSSPRTVSSPKLPVVDLMPHFTRREALVNYWSKIVTRSSTRGDSKERNK